MRTPDLRGAAHRHPSTLGCVVPGISGRGCCGGGGCGPWGTIQLRHCVEMKLILSWDYRPLNVRESILAHEHV